MGQTGSLNVLPASYCAGSHYILNYLNELQNLRIGIFPIKTRLSNLFGKIQQVWLHWTFILFQQCIAGSNWLLLLCGLQFALVSSPPYCFIPGPLHLCLPSSWPLYAYKLVSLLSFSLLGKIMHLFQQYHYGSNHRITEETWGRYFNPCNFLINKTLSA